MRRRPAPDRRRPALLRARLAAGMVVLASACATAGGAASPPVPPSTGTSAPAPDAGPGAHDPDGTGGAATEPPATTPPTTEAPTTVTTVGTTTTTAPVTEPASGVLQTRSGLLVPVRARRLDGSGWVVGTPCGGEAVASGTLRAPGVDVVLDPGHGGLETGTVGPNGLRESDLNLDVALRLERWLETAGLSVELTRRDATQITLDARAELASSLAPSVLVSVHHNGGHTRASTEPGTIVFHQVDAPSSRRLAGILNEEVTAALRPLDLPWTAGSGPGAMAVRNVEGTDYYGILRGTTTIPAVIVEALYLTNGPEAEALQRDDVRQLEAEAIGRAIVRYRTTADPGSGYRNELTFAPGSVPRREPFWCNDPALG